MSEVKLLLAGLVPSYNLGDPLQYLVGAFSAAKHISEAKLDLFYT